VEIVLYVERGRAERLRDLLLRDDLVSRANVILKDAGFLDRDGFYVRIIGSEEQCERALEISKELAVEVSGEERERVLRALKEEDEEVLSGFSGIFR